MGQLVFIRSSKPREGITVDAATRRKIKDATGQTPGQFFARFGTTLAQVALFTLDELVAFVERRLKAERND